MEIDHQVLKWIGELSNQEYKNYNDLMIMLKRANLKLSEE